MTIEEYFKNNDLKFEVFNKSQKEQIILGLSENIDVSLYTNPKYKWKRMRKIRFNLLDQKYKVYEYLESQNYKRKDFNSDQISQIRWGLKEGLDVSKYTNPKCSSSQMSLIRLRLKLGINNR